MEGEIDNPDLEPTSEEGQSDINDTIDNEFDELIPQYREPRDRWLKRLRQRFGKWTDYAADRIENIRRSKREGPEFIPLEDLDLKEQLQRENIENIKERFPKLDLARIDVQTGDKGQIQVKLSGKSKWYNLYQRKNSNIINKNLSKEITEALGEENLTVQMEKADDSVDSKTASLTKSENDVQRLEAERDELVEELKNKDKEYQNQYRLWQEGSGREREDFQDRLNQINNERKRDRETLERLKGQLDAARQDVHDKEITLNGALEERRQLQQRINTLEEQIRQRDQSIEDLEQNIEQQREIIADQSRPEEERTAAERELQELQERLEELHKQRENLERELGLTTKEKIKRALLKYGIPAAFAVAVAGTVAAIMSALKGVGAGVKNLGTGLKELGKKMAASVPGLLGTVLSLVLKTGGELLKFVGNNIWILVVAIGAILLKKLKI